MTWTDHLFIGGPLHMQQRAYQWPPTTYTVPMMDGERTVKITYYRRVWHARVDGRVADPIYFYATKDTRCLDDQARAALDARVRRVSWSTTGWVTDPDRQFEGTDG